MVWNAYLDNIVIQAAGSKNCDKACIIQLDGGEQMTTGDHPHGLQLSEDERLNIATSFKSKDFSAFAAKGIQIEGVEYQFIQSENDKLVNGKKQHFGAITLRASKSYIVIGHCPEGGSLGNFNMGVDLIVWYLESMDM